MNWKSYLANLRQVHRQSLAETLQPGPVDQNLNLILAGACGLGALIMVAAGGYRTGFESIHGFGHHFSTSFIETLTFCGDTSLAVCLMALLARRRPRVLWMGVLAGVYATLLSHGLKTFINTARPPVVLGERLTVIGPVWHWHSLPSGHTVTAFVVAACFSVGARKSTKFLFYALAAAVGASRVWVGVHWPVDVIAGAACAGVSVALAIRTTKSTSWGLGLAPHIFFVLLAAGCAVLSLIKTTEYPHAEPLSVSIAVISLCVLARDYGYRPLMLRKRSTGDLLVRGA